MNREEIIKALRNFNGDFSGDVMIRNHELKVSADVPFVVLKRIVALVQNVIAVSKKIVLLLKSGGRHR